MPRSRKRTFTLTFNGIFDKRNRSGQTPVSGDKKKVTSVKQGDHLSRFEKAKEYGRKVVADSALTEHYAVYHKRWKRKLVHTGIYQLAIMDFMNSPTIHEAMITKDSGNCAKTVLVNVWEKFEIRHVTVSMIAPDGKILETGEIYKQNNQGFHEYTLNNPASENPGVICRISAHDFPGNVTEKDYQFFG